jgi:methionine--tRNA ligase beta chain
MITIDDFKKVEIRAGKIISAEAIEGSEKLLKLMVDFGSASAEGFDGTKQVLSGIAKFVSPQDLIGTTCAFVTNLEPRQIMGLESQAMIMAVSGDLPADEAGNFFSLLKLSENVPPGSLVK